MIFSGIQFISGLYFFISRSQFHLSLENAFIGASMMVFGMGYLMYCFLRTIEMLQKGAKEQTPRPSLDNIDKP
jgi:hypothetical protein